MVFKRESIIQGVTISTSKYPVTNYKYKSQFYNSELSKRFGDRFSFKPYVNGNTGLNSKIKVKTIKWGGAWKLKRIF